jgi:TRAP-type C4-dicarboxylate transport system substrate-binding protein
MKKLLTLVFAIVLTGSISSAMFAQDAATTGATPGSTTNQTQEKSGVHSRAKRQHIKNANGASEQREERTNGKVEERRETRKLKNGKVVTRKQRKQIK